MTVRGVFWQRRKIGTEYAVCPQCDKAVIVECCPSCEIESALNYAARGGK